MTIRTPWIATLVSLLALAPLAAQAIPVTYRFTTDTANQTMDPANALFESALAGFSVSGTFDYDSVGAPVATIPGGSLAGSSVYLTLSNLMGSVGGHWFSDPGGLTIVGNDTFTPQVPSPPPSTDFLGLHADGNVVQDLNGFSLAGFDLLNVRLFWLETFIAGTPDFLSSQNLPSMLPSFVGRLALDFGDANGVVGRVFFENLTVVRVPEPGSLALLCLGLLGITLRRRLGST